jgi:hypothetical protein
MAGGFLGVVMGEVVDLKKFKDEAENKRLHEISRRVEIVDDNGNVIATIYHPLSPMAFKQRMDQFEHMINYGPISSICAVEYAEEPLTLWQKIKRFFGAMS